MMSLRPSHVRCNAQVQGTNQRAATTRLPSSSLLGDRIRRGYKMTPATAFAAVLRERGKGESIECKIRVCAALQCFGCCCDWRGGQVPRFTLDRTPYHPAATTAQSAQTKALLIRIRRRGSQNGPATTRQSARSLVRDSVWQPLYKTAVSVAQSHPPHFDMLLLSPLKALNLSSSSLLDHCPSGAIDYSPLFWARIH